MQDNKDYEKREDVVENFLADDSSSDENIEHNTNGGIVLIESYLNNEAELKCVLWVLLY